MKQTVLRLAVLAALSSLSLGAEAGGMVKEVEFSLTPAPATDREMTQAYTRSWATVIRRDGSRASFPLHYHSLYRSGETVGGARVGRVVDRNGQAILASAPNKAGDAARGPFDAWSPDANSLLAVPGAKAGKAGENRLFLVTHFEYHTEAPNLDPAKPPVDLYAQLPMAMNLTAIGQDRKTGRLSAAALGNIDMAAVGGLWIPCAGTLTAWNTHLGGEEYEPDAKHFEARPLEAMNLYLGTPGKTAAEGGANPYAYGHPVEVKVGKEGKTQVAKHYAMGRLSFELADILPDGRTAYIGDDGKDVGLFLFVANRRADLSAGTLYAAQWRQTAADEGGAADLTWIRLGHATDEDVSRLVRGGIRFSDIFESADRPAEGFRPVYAYAGTGGKAVLEYLKLKPGMEQAAAFLETRRYAAYLGATTEFTKMEGQTHNAKGKKLYTAISYIEGGMVEGKNGERPRDDIRLAGDPKVLACGAVYQSDLRGGVKDSEGRAMDSDWVAVSMKALIMGAKKPADQTAYGKYDKCDTDKVANPDNIKYSAALDTLFIGEDSGNHLNNFLWAYRVGDGRLTRLASAPIGAEWTGLQVAENLNGFAYVMANIQHPGAAKDLEKYPDEVRVKLRGQVDQRGGVGYLGALPAVK